MQIIESRLRQSPGHVVAMGLGMAMCFVLPIWLIAQVAGVRGVAGTAVVLPALVLASWMSIMAARSLLRREAESHAWTLSADTLTRGLRGAERIRLADIVSIAQGVPGLRRRNPWADASLVIRLRDGRLLLLNLTAARQGDALMAELVKRCAPVWTVSPHYTVRERALLQGLHWNRPLWPAAEG